MVYKLIGNYKKDSLWEISVFKYNINHQEFLTYVKEGNITSKERPQKRVFRTELIE